VVLAFRFLTSDEVGFMEWSFRKGRLSETYRRLIGDVFTLSEPFRLRDFVGPKKFDITPVLRLKSLIDEIDLKCANYACFDDPFATIALIHNFRDLRAPIRSLLTDNPPITSSEKKKCQKWVSSSTCHFIVQGPIFCDIWFFDPKMTLKPQKNHNKAHKKTYENGR
jgi:hypothetical protein